MFTLHKFFTASFTVLGLALIHPNLATAQGPQDATGAAGPQGPPGPNYQAIALLKWYPADQAGIQFGVGNIPTAVAFDGASI